jgi:hypothetical protein
VVDGQGNLVYQGAIDSKPSAKKEDVKGATNYVAQVLDALLAGQDAPLAKTQPYGCSVKYAPKAQAKACTHCDVASKDACQCKADAATDQVPEAVACPCSPKPAKPDSGDEDDQQTA